MNDTDRPENRLRRALDARAGSFDAATLSRLRQARAAALEQAHRSTGPRRPAMRSYALPAGAFASLLAVAVGVSVWLQTPPPADDAEAIFESSEMLAEMAASDVDIDLLEEIEFYDWLALMQANGDSA